MKRFSKHVLPAAIFAIGLQIACRAAEFRWVGEHDSRWATAANWQPNIGTPGEGDVAILTCRRGPATIRLSSDVALDTLVFDSGALHSCELLGQSLTLGDGASVRFEKLPGDVGMGKSASATISSALELSGEVSFANMNRHYLGGEYLRIAGPISGSGSIVIEGVPVGTVQLLGDNSKYKGRIVIKTGSLKVSHAAALGASDQPIRLEGGSIIIGARISTVKDLNVVADAAWDAHGPNGTHDGRVTINEAATLTIKNGGGNTMTVRGVIAGDGDLNIVARGTTFSGSSPNTLSGTTFIGGDRGPTILAREKGVDVIAGPLVMRDVGTLRWDSDEQIANDATITFVGTMPTFDLRGHSESFGPLNLQSDARLDLGESAGQIMFADSSAQDWEPDSVMLIQNGGKGRSTVRFGASDKGLTPSQLERIGFVDPVGFPPGTYTAQLGTDGDLSPSGELVQPRDLPFDGSATARAERKRLYEVPGLARLSGEGTPLKQEMVLSIFGDSITWGDGYVRQIRSALASGEGSKELGVKVINHGCNGAGVLVIRDGDDSKSHFGNTRPQPFAKTIATEKADVAVIFIGVNDVWWRKTTPEVFEETLRDLVTQAKANTTTPVLATLAMMKEEIGNRDPKCDQFADVTRKVARETGATLVDLRAGFMACMENESVVIRPGGTWTSNGRLLTHDGVHTNSYGDTILANLIAQGIFESLSE